MRLLIIIFILFAISSADAQKRESYSKIKLKDGSELRVTVIENIPGKYVKIKFSGDQVSTLNYADIASIRHKNYVYQSRFVLPRKFYIDGSFGLIFGKVDDFGTSRVGMSISVAGNYRLNSYLSLGLGIEPSALYINSNYLLLPIYLHVTGNLAERRTSAFYMFDLGYSTADSNETDSETIAMDGGIFIRPGIGIRFNKVVVGLSYQIQKISTTRNSDLWWGDQRTTIEERTMRNVRLGFSIIF